MKASHGPAAATRAAVQDALCSVPATRKPAAAQAAATRAAAPPGGSVFGARYHDDFCKVWSSVRIMIYIYIEVSYHYDLKLDMHHWLMYHGCRAWSSPCCVEIAVLSFVFTKFQPFSLELSGFWSQVQDFHSPLR